MTDAATLTSEQKRQALDIALRSKTFHRSEQLKAFLRYVVEADLQGRADELTEQLIGVEVLGRPPGYSPAEDSSVRTRAYELRQKLEKLYAMEATGAPVQIALPRGSYIPQYTWHGEAQPKAPRIAAPSPRIFGAAQVMAVVALVCVAVAIYVGATHQSPSVDPVVAEAWGPFNALDANVALCVATPLHLTVGPATHEAFGTPNYPAPPEVYPAFRQHRPLAPDAKLGLLITDNVLGVGTMNAVVAAVNTLRSLGSSYQILPEHVAPLSALRNRNMILFGAPVDSDAITQTLESTPLTVDYSEKVREFVIHDRETGQLLIPRKDARGEFVDVYGLITVINNRESDRGQLGAIVFSGITSTGTHGAAEYFSSPRTLRDLRARLKLNGFPASYQVVIRCTFNNKLLLTYDYHSHRVITR